MFFKKNGCLFFYGVLSFFIACTSEDRKSDDNQLAGTFYGILPCASCEGIHTCILLKKDSFIEAKYYSSGRALYDMDSLGRTYMSKSNNIYIDSGKILSWNKEKRIFYLDPSDSSEKIRNQRDIDSNAFGYLYADTALFILDSSNKVIEGSWGEYYILKRMPKSFNFEEEMKPLIRRNDSLQDLTIMEYDKKRKRTNSPKTPTP